MTAMLTAIPYKNMLQGALSTILTLFGGLLLGVMLGRFVSDLPLEHSLNDLSGLRVGLTLVVAPCGPLLGSALWGVLMGRFARSGEPRRMALAGMFGFVPIVIVLGYGLSVLEHIAVEQLGDQLPIHRLFTLLFVPSVFLVAAISAGAIGIGLRNARLAWTLFWQTGIAAALTFLAIDLVMEAMGWVVGAPGAEQRTTMLTVLFAGNAGAALVGGAILGGIVGSMGRTVVSRTVELERLSA